jgi:hypothetical protein
MRPTRIAGLVLLALMVAPIGLQGQKTVLVELFTSEGCSSCPPADALLRQVNGSQTSAGQLIVGISEHVTYWNHLGWSDPYSSSTYTDRQDAYSQRFHLEGVYTPQMVINGAEQIVGSDRAALLRAVMTEEAHPSQMTLRILSVEAGRGGWNVHFSAGGELPAHGVDVIAVLADDSDQSNVLHGENSGRTLAHVAVARSISKIAKLQTAGEGTAQIPIPSSFQASPGHHLILFAQTPGNGRVLGADTKPL